MILKSMLPEDTDIWHISYDRASQDLSILGHLQANIDLPIYRHQAAIVLFRAYKNQLFSLEHVGYESFVLQNRTRFISDR